MSAASGASGRGIEAMGALGFAVALQGDCDPDLEVLRDALAKAMVLGDAVRDRHGLSRAGEHALRLRRARRSGRGRLRGAPLGSRVADTRLQHDGGGGPGPARALARAEAILASVAIAYDEGSGALWNANFGGIMAVRAGRSDEGAVLLDVRRAGTDLLSDAAFAGNLAGGLIELALLDGRLEDARSAVDDGLEWLADADDVRFRARILRLGVAVEAENATIARARRDAKGEAAARSIGHARLERLRWAARGSGRWDEQCLRRGARQSAPRRGGGDAAHGRPGPSSVGDRRRCVPVTPSTLRARVVRISGRGGDAGAPSVARGGDRHTGGCVAWAVDIGAIPLQRAIERLATIARLALPTDDIAAATDRDHVTDNGEADDQVSDPYGLTGREREVLTLLAAGQTNRAIAESLFISESTASVHVSNIIGKLGVSNRVEAAAAAVRAGLAR